MNAGLQPQLWHDTFLAFATVCGALLGLFAVAITLRADQLEHYPLELYRAKGGLVGLGVGLVESLLLLTPNQSLIWLGTEVVAAQIGFLILVFAGYPRGAKWARDEDRVIGRLNTAVNLTAVLLAIVGGISLLAGQGPGIYLLVPQVAAMGPMCTYFVWSVIFPRSAASRGGPSRRHAEHSRKPHE